MKTRTRSSFPQSSTDQPVADDRWVAVFSKPLRSESWGLHFPRRMIRVEGHPSRAVNSGSTVCLRGWMLGMLGRQRVGQVTLTCPGKRDVVARCWGQRVLVCGIELVGRAVDYRIVDMFKHPPPLSQSESIEGSKIPTSTVENIERPIHLAPHSSSPHFQVVIDLYECLRDEKKLEKRRGYLDTWFKVKSAL